ncbi:MAG: hypothetical protein KDI39_07135, partial [Pseudomonadales bacterium]|nr:hypothetical protein [Pseudomonadales bacterium]
MLLVPMKSAWALVVPATKDLSCAGFRDGGKLTCTAGEFTVSPSFSAAPGTPPFCIAGQDFNFQVDLRLSGTNTDRYDIGFFVGQQGNDPRDTTAGNICSVATFPKNTLPEVTPWEDDDGDACGDYNGGGDYTQTVNEIKVVCQSSGTATSDLAIPFLVTYKQNTGGTCTGPTDVTNGAPSKCNAGTGLVNGTVAVNVGTYLDVTKQTNPDGNSQTFSFTATGPSGSKVIALTGATLTPTSATGGTYTPATIATATNTTTVSISDGQTVRFYMTGLTTSQELKVREDLVTGWEPTPSISCAAVTGAPTFTTPTNLNTPLAEIPFTRIVNLSTTNSAAACTFTNTKRPTLTLTKVSQGGTGTFTFTGDNGWASQGITTTAAGGAGTLGATQTLTTSSTATTITEALPTGYVMTGVSCTGMGAGGTVTPNLSAGTFTLDAAATAAGSDIACTVTNSKTPTVKVQKITTGAVGGPFSFSQTNLVSNPSNITTTATSTATPASPTAINIVSTGTAVTITESPASGFALSTASCTDANSAITGNTGSTFATLSGNTLTIPAVNVKSGADFSCTFTNTKRPSVKITKVSNGGVGSFDFSGDNGFGSQTITTLTSGVGVDGTTTLLTNANQVTTITETVPTGYVLTNINCTGLGTGSATYNLGAGSVTLSTNATAATNNVACTFTNNKLPTIRLTKVSVDNNGVFNFSGNNGFGSDSIITSTSGVGVTGTTKTLTSSAFTTSTVITETVPSNYTLTGISCTGLGSGGTATNNLGAGRVTLNPAATAAGADINCTFTNTANTSTGGSFPSQIACNATELGQTFEFNATNTWPSGTSTKSFVVGTAPNNVTLTFTNTQAVTAMTGDPSLRTYGGVPNSLTISSNGGLASNTLISTLGLVPSRAINKLSFSIYDSDYYNGGGYNFRDRTISTSNAGNPTSIFAQNPSNETISGNITTGTPSADCGTNDANCNLYFAYNLNGITNATMQFYAAHTSGTSTQQLIALNQYAWCLPKHPTVTISKTTTGGTGSFTFSNTNLASASTNLTTASAGVAVNSTPINVTNLASNVQIQETVPSNWQLLSASCTDANGALTSNGTGTFGSLAGNTLTIPSANLVYGADIRCSFTNRKTAQLTLRKTWVNANVNDEVTVATTGGAVNLSLVSTANTANETDTSLTLAVLSGDTLTLSETFNVGSAANYNASVACTGATDTNLADGLTINAADSNIVCTYTNTRKTATFRLAKAWGANSIAGNVANIGATTGLTNNTTAFTSTASTNTNGATVTVYAGETATLPAETFSSGTLANYTTTLSCDNGITPSSTNGQNSNTVTIPNTVSGLVTCTYTNMRIAQNLTLAKQWANASTGHTAIVTTTGGTNNATVNSTSTGNNLTTGTGVTVYAGDVVTLPAETFGGGASASDYNTNLACTGGSTLASGAVGRSITISNSTIATTCTYTNAKLPNITITKISNGGVGSFDFTGTNGFSNQTITTVSSGVGVAGATQRLTTAGVATQITETVPYGFALTNVSCTGLGTGTATVNYNTATVTLDANATAGPNNIACTFTNTAYGTTPTDPLLKTTRFSAVPDVPTIVRGFSGTQTIVMTNHGPDDATNVVVYYRPLLATGVSVTSVSSPAGTCTFSSPDWVCPAIASVLNGASFNITVTYSTTNASSLGIAQQGEVRVNSNEYTECGGVNEYKYNVWGSGGNAQPQPAPTNSAFWVGNTNTTTTATPSGAYSTESTDIFQAWPLNQDSPTGSYLYSPVAGQHNNIYSPSSTNATPTVSKVLT